MDGEKFFQASGVPSLKSAIAFLVLLLILGSLAPVRAQQAEAILTANVLEVGIDLEIFQAVPSSVLENETTLILLTVRNLGSYDLEILPTSRFEIYKDNVLIHTLSIPTVTISPGARTDIILPWNVAGFPLGVFRLRAVVDWTSAGFRPKAPATAYTTLEIRPVVPPLPPVPPPAPPVFYRLRVLRFPVLIEERTGDATLVSFEIVNEGPGAVENARVELTVAENWMVRAIEAFPSSISLSPGERTTVNLLIKVPSTAAPGDYGFKVTVRGENSFAEMISVLRVRTRLPDPYALALRHVDLDLENGETVVKLIAKNGSKFLRALILTDNVPPELARSLDTAFFEQLPEEISPPAATWRLQEFQPFEEREVVYRLAGIIPDYQRYLYWQFPRVIMVYELVELIRITDLKSEFLRPGGTGKLTVTLRNLSDENLLVTAILRLPTGWTAQPDGVSMKLEPAKSGAFVFYVTIPSYAEPMTYMGELRIYFKDQEMVRGIAFVVMPPGYNVWLIVLLVLAAATAVVLAYLLKRRRYSLSRRPEVIELLRRAGEEA